jgi:hypothetical protein
MADAKITALPVPSTISNEDVIPFAKVSTSVTSGINFVSFESVMHDNSQLTGITNIQTTSIVGALNVAGSGNFIKGMTVSGAGSALGYITGAGGVVTQSVGGAKSLAVILNRATGKIILSNSVMAASTLTSVFFGNSVMGVNDMLMLNYVGNGLGGTTMRSYQLNSSMVSAGAAVIMVKSQNNFADTSSIFVQFAVIKSDIS